MSRNKSQMYTLISLAILFSLASCMKNINVWPYPLSYLDTTGGKTVEFDTINFKLYDEKKQSYVPIEQDKFVYPMVKRYTPILYDNQADIDRKRSILKTSAYSVIFQIYDLNDRTLDLKTNESYTLHIDENTATINSANVFGSLRGLESLAQLVTSKTLSNLPILINDSPRYAWRGLMVDVARHYLHLETLYKIIDGMQFNKLNSLHLHLVDAQSFPLVVPKYPLLSEKGAYDSKNAIFTPEDLENLKTYSYLRGVRVIPEIDVPGHAASWGNGYPGSTAICDSFKSNINNIPLDPTVTLSHELVQGILDSLGNTFDDDYFHFGGDEVVYRCWEEIPHIAEYMKNHSMDGKDLQGWFMNQAFQMTKKTPIAWQELAQDMPSKTAYQLPKDILVEVWKNPEDMKTVLENGYEQIINSAGWYLDRQIPIAGALHYLMLDVWMDMWVLEPENYVHSKDAHKILGGEACMWGEQINDFVALERIFPSACAVAERLWSPKSTNLNKNDINELQRRRSVQLGEIEEELFRVETTLDIVSERLNYHVCHNMNLRGITASPIHPNYCPYSNFG